MRRVTPQPSFGHDLSASLLDRFREYSVALNQLSEHRFSEFVSVTGTYTAGQNDHIIECAPSGTMTVTLPAASVMRNKRIIVKRTNNTTHVITINSVAGNIDGFASVTLTTAYQSREVFSDGSNWWLLEPSVAIGTKWDSANMGPSNTLSNSDMTATVTAADRCYATKSYSAGEKRYFEILVGTQANTWGVIALSIQDDVINTIFESTACSVTSEFSDGDVVGVTLDTSGSYAIHDFYVNNSLVRTRSLSAGSASQTYFPCVGDQWSNTAGSTFVFTGRFKSADMTYSPPSGFTAWDD